MILEMINLTLTTHLIPDNTKLATIILLPKISNWMGQLDKTRPITLLETYRKIVTAIITRRLTSIIDKYITLNEIADEHAKRATTRTDISETNDTNYILNLGNYKLVCRDGKPIDQYCRKMIKNDHQNSYQKQARERLQKLWKTLHLISTLIHYPHHHKHPQKPPYQSVRQNHNTHPL
jgi:hypothetical protein